MKFSKAHAYGNDFLYVRASGLDADSSRAAQDDRGGRSGEKFDASLARKRSCGPNTIRSWPCRLSF